MTDEEIIEIWNHSAGVLARFARAIERRALEDAAKVCDDEAESREFDEWPHGRQAAESCAYDIRALIYSPPSAAQPEKE